MNMIYVCAMYTNQAYKKKEVLLKCFAPLNLGCYLVMFVWKNGLHHYILKVFKVGISKISIITKRQNLLDSNSSDLATPYLDKNASGLESSYLNW